MAYASRDVQNARRRAHYAATQAHPRKPGIPRKTWTALDRAKRAFAGICRDCPRPCPRTHRQTVLCDVCAAKQQERRPEALQEFNERKQLIRAQAAAHFHPLRDDRRQGGRTGAALAWALQMRSI